MNSGTTKPVVLHLLYSGLGGHGSVFFSLIEADREKQFDYQAVFCGIEDLRSEYSQKCNAAGVPYIFIKKKKGLDLGVYWKIFRQFRKSKASTVFLHGVSFLMPAVWYRITKPSSRIIIRDSQAHHLKSKSEWFWSFLALFFAKRIVFLTEASKEGIRKKFSLFASRKKLVIIPNGLNMEKYSPIVKATEQKDLSIGMQSRLQPIKDHATLIKAFRNLKDKLPGRNISLHIAGDGETMPAIKTLVEELGLANEVHLHGMLDENELLTFMKSLDIYVHATFGETLSNSIMQAMACGLPVIASDVWGVNNMITHGQNGLLYPGENVEVLTSEIQRLILDPEQRIILGNNARFFALANYSNEKMFESYKQLYK
jgi:glycosyltransferase involved in cell wall biosynthesis